MSKVFRITPKCTRRVNGQPITPEMMIAVATRQHCTNPFYNGAVEVKEQYMRMYQFNPKKVLARIRSLLRKFNKKHPFPRPAHVRSVFKTRKPKIIIRRG